MKKIIVILVLLLAAKSVVFASDSLKVFLQTEQTNQKLEVYRYKTRSKENVIFKIRTGSPHTIASFTLDGSDYKEGALIEFWIFVKHKCFFGGTWINVVSKYEKDKDFLIFYSSIRKKKYCYDSMWIDKNKPPRYRD